MRNELEHLSFIQTYLDYDELLRIEIIKYLLENNADLNVKNNLGSTVLHVAAENSSLKIVKFLVEEKQLGKHNFVAIIHF